MDPGIERRDLHPRLLLRGTLPLQVVPDLVTPTLRVRVLPLGGTSSVHGRRPGSFLLLYPSPVSPVTEFHFLKRQVGLVVRGEQGPCDETDFLPLPELFGGEEDNHYPSVRTPRTGPEGRHNRDSPS